MTSILSNLTLPACILVIAREKIVSVSIGVLALSSFANLVFALLAFLLAKSNYFYALSDFSSPGYFIVLISLSSFSLTATQVFANINIRNKKFRNNVVVNLTENISIRIASLLMGTLGVTKFGLFYSEMLGRGLNIANQLLFKTISVRDLFEKSRVGSRKIFDVIIENRDYPLFNLPVALITTFSGQLVLWVLVLSYSRTDVGYFTMALGLLNIPLMLFSNSIQPLLTSRLSDAKEPLSLRFFVSVIIKIFTIALFTYAIVYFATPYFINVYLGVKWLPSVPFIQILCFPFVFQLVGNSIGGAFLVFKRQRANFVIKVVFLLILLIGFYVLYMQNAELNQVIIFYAIVLLLEEGFKVTYLSLQLTYVRNS